MEIENLQAEREKLTNEIVEMERAVAGKRNELYSINRQIKDAFQAQAEAIANYSVGTIFVSPYGMEYVSTGITFDFETVDGEQTLAVHHNVQIMKNINATHECFLRSALVRDFHSTIAESWVGTRYFAKENCTTLPSKKEITAICRKVGSKLLNFLGDGKNNRFGELDMDALCSGVGVDFQESPHLLFYVLPRIVADNRGMFGYSFPNDDSFIQKVRQHLQQARALVVAAGYPVEVIDYKFNHLPKHLQSLPVLKILPKPVVSTEAVAA